MILTVTIKSSKYTLFFSPRKHNSSTEYNFDGFYKIMS